VPYVDVGKLRLHYEDYGSGETVLFLHGFTLDRRMWQRQAAFLESSYRVILLDARGHGLSDCPKTGYSRADRVADLVSFADRLKIKRFHLVGLSMGGSTGIGLALEHQGRLISLTLVSTGAAGYDIGKKISSLDRMAREKGIEATRERWKQMSLAWFREGREEIRQLMQTMIDQHSGAVWMDPMRGKYPREHDLDRVHSITVPTWIVAGGLDQVFVKLARLLRERIPGSSLTVYENAGHMVNLETPTRFDRDLKRFLDRIPRS
jgi:pimeloyl-ACP methyl ester carboxylesterase